MGLRTAVRIEPAVRRPSLNSRGQLQTASFPEKSSKLEEVLSAQS